MAIVKWMLVSGVSGYVLLVGLLYIGQRAMLYHPVATRISPAAAGLPEAEEVLLATADGEKVIAWHVPPRELVADGTGLIALSYRGYAGSTGTPTEEGLHRDAQAAYEFAVARYAPERIVLWGHSLGTGVAVRLASEKPVAKVILEAPYSSTADVAAALFPFVPVRWLMHDQFRSDEWIAAVKAPVLILHGALDTVVALRFGERLFALAREPKRIIRYERGNHIDLDDHGAGAAAREFIAEAAKR